MLRLFDYHESGNAYKVRLLLSLLGRPFERVHLDILKGQTRTEEFRKQNPNQRVPALQLDDGRCIAESNAILYYLAQGTPYWPADPVEAAQVLQWMFFEQYSHEPYIAVVRFWHFAGQVEANQALLPDKFARGYAALDVMEGYLAQRRYFVGGRYSIADIALYAYTHVAHEGKFDLEPYPGIRAWLERVAAQPGHVGIEDEVGTSIDWP